MTPDLDKLAALAGAATGGAWESFTGFPDAGGVANEAGVYRAGGDPEAAIMAGAPWTEQLAADAAYIAALSPDVVLALIERVRALEQAVGGFLWLGNNLHNIARAPTRFRELYEAALVDARAVLADPHDARDDEALARWTAARIDGGVG